MSTTLTEQQKHAVETIEKNVLVSAGAGSGKTHVLVERYIEILRNDSELSVDNLIAVTFTRKAAGEMRTRLKSRFQELVNANRDKKNNRWITCLAEVDRARIGTIHSLCETILKAFPAEAGIDPDFEVLNELEHAELLSKSIDQAFREVIGEQSEEQKLLLQFNIDDVRRWLSTLMDSAPQFRGIADHVGKLSEEDLFQHMRKVRHRIQTIVIRDVLVHPAWIGPLSYLSQTPFKDKSGALDGCRQDVIRLANSVEKLTIDLSPDNCNEIWMSLKQIGEIRTRAGGNGDEAKALREQITKIRKHVESFLKKLPENLNDVDKDAFETIRAIVVLWQRAYAIYEQEKRNALRLDYNDLIWLCFQMLTNPESQARRHYNKNIRALLIDEFQDTNPMQARVISYLAGENTRLFLIGDDKQSIYKFQGADVSTFNEWKGILDPSADPKPDQLTLSGARDLVSLSVSFRSHPDVVSFVNCAFHKLMADATEHTGYRARYAPLAASRPLHRAVDKDGAEISQIQVTLYSTTDHDEKPSKRKTEQIEARTVADWIYGLVERKAPLATRSETRTIAYGDFAILVPRNSDFERFEVSLSELGIPYVTLAGSGFLDRQEIYDMENLCSFLGCPQDSHSLLGVLRSPIFAVTDDIIHRSWAGSKLPLWHVVQDVVKYRRPGFEQLARPMHVLKRLLEESARRSMPELLRKIILDTGYDLVLMGVPNGHQRSRNLWKLITLANENDELTCLEFARSLKLMREYNVRQSDAPLDSGDSVKLMTIHASKGLEFGAVALPGLGAAVNSRTKKLLFHREYGIAFNTARTDEDEVPPWFEYASHIEGDMEIAERKRLLYVAMTRARDYLGMFLERDARNVQSFRSWLMDLLELREDDLCEGVRHLSSPEGSASYELMIRNEDAASGRRHRLVHRTTDSANLQSNVQFDLAEPLMPSPSTPPSAGEGLLRVTPLPGQEPSLDAALVGTFFHALMEHLPDSMDRLSHDVILDIAINQGPAVAHHSNLQSLTSEGERLLESFYTSDLCNLLKASKRRLHELPYMILTADSGANKRRPDLVFLDADGIWHLVDYKTDHFKFADIENQAARHRRQIESYVEDIRKLTGSNCRAHIYFAQFGKLYSF